MSLTIPVEIVFSCAWSETLSPGEQNERSSQRYNMLRTSEQLPLAMFRKLMNFASDPDSDPSAMLFIIETEAR